MFKILQIIAGWFGSGGAVSALFTWLGVKFTSKSLILGVQITTISFLFSARAGFLWSVLEVAKLTINGITFFLNSLPTMLTSDAILSLAYNVLRSFGIIDAFIDAFSLFNTLFVAILFAWILHFAFLTFKITSDEFFKIGMLLQA